MLYFGTSVFELRESTAPSTITVISTESSTSDGRSTKILTVFSSPSPELTVSVTTEPPETEPSTQYYTDPYVAPDTTVQPVTDDPEL